MLTADDLQAQIDSIDAKLTSGVTRQAENGHFLQFDMAQLRLRRSELETKLNRLQCAPAQVRRVLTVQMTKGL